jgi:DNA polymerase-3 subunit delta
MKISPKQADSFVKNPDADARVILVYGPDHGLVQERSHALARHLVEDINDPFNAVHLQASDVADDPALLSDEATAISMMGGARLIRITQASDNLTQALKTYLEAPSRENLVIIEAGNLTPKSGLRQLCEKSGQAAALACYVEDAHEITSLIQSILNHAGYAIDRDAMQWLASHITGDRGRIRAELDKLITYMGPAGHYEGPDGAPVNNRLGTVSLEDAQACCGGGGVEELDDLVYAYASGEKARALQAYDRLLAEGMPTIAILRALQNHFRRLHIVRTAIDAGTPQDTAMKQLQPPVFFKRKQAFERQLKRYSTARLLRQHQRFQQIEIRAKQTGAPDITILAHRLLAA